MLRSGLYLAGSLILFVSIITLVMAAGCGGGGGGGTGLPLSPLTQNGIITGKVIASDLIIASRLSETTAAVKAGTQDVYGAEIWIEQLPNIRTQTGIDGRFTLTGVPLGNYRIVAKLFSALSRETYKIRTADFVLTENLNAHDTGNLGLKKALNQVQGILRNNAGQPLPYVQMVLWGETFTTGSDGSFLTPPVPGDETSADITVQGSGELKQTTFNVDYITGTIPIMEVSIPKQTETQRAPVVNISASSVQVSPSDVVTVAADAVDPMGMSKDRLGFNWSASAGQLASGAYPWSIRWTAPSYNALATVSVVVTNLSGLTGTARIPITVGSGSGVNQRPVISGVVASGTRGDITITYTLTDAENDAVSLTVQYSIDNGTTWNTTANVTGLKVGITPGTGRSIVWNSLSDVSGASTTVRVKLTPADAGGIGSSDISSAFALDNNTIVANTAPVISNLTASGTSGNIAIGYTLADSQGDTCSISVEYSTNGGSTWTSTANVVAASEVVPGTGRTITWSSSADIISNQVDVKVRLTPSDGKISGSSVVSASFAVRNGGLTNTAPVVSNVIASGTGGNITIGYTLADNEGNACSVAVGYSLNGGTTWATTTNLIGSTGIAPGTGKTLVWASALDVTGNESSVRVRLTPNDGKVSGNTVLSGVFPVNNGAHVNSAPVISGVTASGTRGSIAIGYSLSDTDGDLCLITVEYSVDGGTIWTSTANVIGASGVTPGTGKILTWSSSADINSNQADVKVRLTPSDGMVTGSAGLSAVFPVSNGGLANTAPVVSEVSASGTSGNITIGYTLADNEGDACSIAVEFSTNGGSTWVPTSNVTGASGIAPGSGRTIIWISASDVRTNESNVKIRLMPSDGKVSGTAVVSSVFTLSNGGIVNTPPVVSGVTASGTSGNITIVYALTDAEGDACSIGVAYSLNGGTTWATTTNVIGSTGVIPGTGKSLIWSSSADVSTNESNVIVRLMAYDGKVYGAAVGTGVFSLSNGGVANTAPVVSGVTVTGTSGNITINYALADAETNACSISVEYSTNGGTSWTPTSNVTGVTGVAPGSGKTTVWISSSDVSTNQATVKIRLTPNDGKVSGLPVTSSVFALQNGGAAVVSNVQAAVSGQDVQLTYDLSEPSNLSCSIGVEYSINNGSSWVATTRLTGPATGIVPGQGRTITWNAGLDVTVPQNTVKIRITPNNGIAPGTPGMTGTFIIGAPNNAPVVSSVTPAGSSGAIAITYSLTDADNDACSIALEYSLDNGSTWTATTHVTGTVAGVMPGTGKTVTWNSSDDFSTNQANVKIRLTANDGKVGGTPGVSGVFAVNNASVATVTNVRTSVTAQTVTLTYDLAESSNQASSIQVEYSLNGGSTWTVTTQLTGTTTGVMPGTNKTIVWNAAQNVSGDQNTVKLRVVANNGSGAGPAGTSALFSIMGVNDVPVVSGVYVSGSSGDITIGYSLTDADSDLCRISVAYSLNDGTTWATTTALTGTTASITSGVGKSIIWNSAADIIGNYTDLIKVRVVANDGEANSASVMSSAFSINNNSLPVISSVSPSGSSGDITVTFALADADGGASSIDVYYSTDGGANYVRTSNITGVTSGITPGSGKTIVWQSAIDVPGSGSNARLKLIPNDGTANGTPGESPIFTANNNHLPVISALSVTGGTGDINIGFTLADADGNPCSIKLSYSTNGGSTWTQSSNISGAVGITSGSGRSIVWNSAADISSLQSNVQVKIMANDGYEDSASLTSTAFTVNNNNLPTVSNVLVSGNSGAITVTYALADADSASCSIKVYYSMDNGGTWTQTTHVTGSVSNVAPGTNRGITWDSTVVIPGNEPSVKLRLVPSDGIGNGTAGESTSFAVNNNTSPTVSNVAYTGNSGDIVVRYDLSDINGDACSVGIEYSINNGVDWIATTHITGTLTGLAPGTGKTFTWRSSEDFQTNQIAVKVRVTPSDRFGAGNSGSSAAFSVNNNSLSVVSNVLTIGSSGTVTISYSLADADGGSSAVSVQYSVDGGVTYAAASNISGMTTGVTPGTGKTISWNTTTDIPGRSTAVKIKLTPNDGSGNGTPGESAVFTVNNNTLPAISGVVTSGSVGDITITYNLTDANNNLCNVRMQYSLDGGGTFNSTTNYSGAVTNVAPGNSRVITWRSASDLSGNQPSVKVRLIANDGYGDSPTAESGTFSVVNNNLPVISGLSITGTSGSIGITYTLADANSDACSVAVAYSTDGSNYTTTSSVSGDTTGVMPGSSRTISWNSSADIPGNALSVRIRLIPHDGTGAGSSAVSSPFAVNNNTAPTVSNVLVSGSSGNITVTYNLTDPNNDQCSLGVFYSLNDGVSWTATTNLTGTVTGLVPGTGKTLIWNSAADVSGTQSTVKVKLVPNDGITAGTEGISGSFALANNGLPTVSNVRTTGSTGAVAITYDLADPNSDPCSISVFYSTDGGVNYTATTALSGATSSIPIGTNKIVTWNSATNVPGAAMVKIKVVPSDGSGTGTPGESANFSITNNSIPVVSAVTTSGANGSIGVTYTLTDADNNPCSVVLYYSIDNGSNYQRSVNVTGSTTAIIPGGGKSLTWLSNLDITGNYGQIKVKVEPNDGYASGTAGISSAFILSNNSLPSIANVVASGTTGDITLTYDLTDANGDACNIGVFYSLNGGISYTRTYNLSGLISNLIPGTGRTVVWNSMDDIQRNETNVKVRIVPGDSYGNGTGGISSVIAINNNHLPIVTNLVKSGSANDITLTYDLNDPDSTPCSVKVFYSLNGGTTWAETSKLTGTVSGIANGTGKSLVWRSYEDFTDNQTSVKLRVSPFDDQETGTSAETATFTVSNNHLPSIASVGSSGASGAITLTYDLTDSDSNPCSISAEFSKDGGTNWLTTSNITGSTTSVIPGVGRTITWNSLADFTTKEANVKIRLKPNDALGDGTTGVTPLFAVNNNSFPVVSSVSTVVAGNSVTITYNLADGNSNPCNMSVHFSSDGGTSWAAATNLVPAPNGVSIGSGRQVVWNSLTDFTGRSVHMKVRVTPNDTFDVGTPGVSPEFILDNNTMPSVNTVNAANGIRDIPITYNLVDANTDPCSITVQYSLDNGATWVPTAHLTGSTTNILPGNGKTITWNSYADFHRVENTVRVRIIPSDPYVAGTGNDSATIVVTNNYIPIVTNVTTTGASGPITVSYDLNDGDGDVSSLTFEYSVNGGTSWAASTKFDGTLTGVATGTGRGIVWRSSEDFTAYKSSVKVRLTPHDGLVYGTLGMSNSFAVNNNLLPVVSSIIATSTVTSAIASIQFDLADANDASLTLSLGYSTDGGTTWATSTSVAESLVNVPTGSGKTLTWNSAPNFSGKKTNVKIRVSATDGVATTTSAVANIDCMNNTPPSITNMTLSGAYSGTTYRSTLSINYILQDPDSDLCNVDLYYSRDSGVTYQIASNVVGSSQNLAQGVWDMTWYGYLNIANNTTATVKLRLVPSDTNSVGTAYNYATTLTVLNNHKPYLPNIGQVSAGVMFSGAVTNTGQLYMWGYNNVGQLGDGSVTATNAPKLIAAMSNVKKISCGDSHVLAVKNDNTLWSWGNNTYGQIGTGTTSPAYYANPTWIASLPNVIKVAAGPMHSLAVKNDGTLWAWGYNGYGQLGNGTTGNSSAPVQVLMPGAANVVDIAGGGVSTSRCFSLAVRADGTVWAWGDNSYNQLGDGTTTQRSTPVQVMTAAGVPLTGVIAVAAGESHSMALKADGTVWSWGYNGYYQVDSTGSTRSYAVQVLAAPATPLTGVVEIDAGGGGPSYPYGFSMALKNDGTVWMWGYNYNGQLGDYTTATKQYPTKTWGLNRITTISAGVRNVNDANNAGHSLAAGSDGTWSWGMNDYNQLGTGNTTQYALPWNALVP